MTSRPLLVVVSGPPAAGKTFIGQALARQLNLPFFNKDGFKEVLFDSLGWSDRAWSRRLGKAGVDLLFHTAERMLAAGGSLVLEANFSADLSCVTFRSLQERYALRAVQVQCVGDGEEFVRRFRARDASGERHPGHVDRDSIAEVEAQIRRGRLDPLCLDGPLIELETTDISALDAVALAERIRLELGSVPA